MVRTELVIASGTTETVASGVTQDTATVSNAGTFSNAGTNTAGGQELTTLSTDIDTATADLLAGALLTGSATDIDQGTTTLSVRLLLSAAATDNDQSTALLSRLRELTGSAADIDSATGGVAIIVSLVSERAVDSIIEILNTPEISDYRNQDPTVLNYWDRTQQERGQGADQPAEIYVWETAGKDIERFSLDNTSTHDTASVEALIYSLDEQEVIDYAEDARNNIEQFFDDNKEETEWQTIEVTSVNDFREQTQRRSTDQYVVSLEIELEKIQEVA